MTPQQVMQRAANAMREDELQENVRQTAALRRWRYYHTHRSQHSPAGFPDVCAIRGSRLLFAELKRERKEPTEVQAAWLKDLHAWAQMLRGCGAIYDAPMLEVYVWRPMDWLDGTITKALA